MTCFILFTKESLKYISYCLYMLFILVTIFVMRNGIKVTKGVRWMPRLLQAMKDVISCDKPCLGANDL